VTRALPAALVLGLALSSASALEGSAQQTRGAERTVTWYADHPDVMARVLGLCRNDPGHGRDNPDCINADQAQILVAEREARAHIGDLTPPSSPRYWAARPQERAEKLADCARMRPEDRARSFCAAAGFGR